MVWVHPTASQWLEFGPQLVREADVTFVNLTDRAPFVEENGDHTWMRGGDNWQLHPHGLPDVIYLEIVRSLRGDVGSVPVCVEFKNAIYATEYLSKACISWAKRGS